MPEWRSTTIGEVCQIRPPKREAKERLKGDDAVSFVPMESLGIRVKCLEGLQDRPLSEVYSGYTYFAEHDVLLAKITPCFQNGKLGIARGLTNGVGFGSSEFFVLRCNDQIMPEFLFYFLSQEAFIEEGVARMGGAVGHQRVPQDYLRDYPIDLPSLPEQERIVAILDEAFAAIATATANAEMNLANAREVFERRLDALFADGSQVWKSQRFGSVCNFVRGPFGGSLRKSCFVDSGFAVYEQQHAINDQFDEIRYFIDGQKFADMSRFELRSGDLIMSCSGTMGRVAIAPEGLMKGIINQALLKLTPGPSLSAEFLKRWMGSQSFQEQLSEHARGVAIKNVASVKVLKEIRVPIPPVGEQRTIVDQLREFEDDKNLLQTHYQRKLDLSSELKEAVLHAAFSGALAENSETGNQVLAEAGV